MQFNSKQTKPNRIQNFNFFFWSEQLFLALCIILSKWLLISPVNKFIDIVDWQTDKWICKNRSVKEIERRSIESLQPKAELTEIAIKRNNFRFQSTTYQKNIILIRMLRTVQAFWNCCQSRLKASRKLRILTTIATFSSLSELSDKKYIISLPRVFFLNVVKILYEKAS